MIGIVVVIIIVTIVVIIVTESPFKVGLYPEPWSFYRTSFPLLFIVFRSLFEVEFYTEP